MKYDFHNKVFRVIKNDGPGAEVNEDTVFYFKQVEDVIHADYFGGQVKAGKFIGLIVGDQVHFKYTQVNKNNDFNSGHSIDQIEITEQNKIRLIDEWEWETKVGRGHCIMEEQ